MCGGWNDGMRFPDLLQDPLIRLVMESDGVTEQEMLGVLDLLRRALAAREGGRRFGASLHTTDAPSVVSNCAVYATEPTTR